LIRKSNIIYIYLHIPKCAGTTIRNNLMSAFESDEVINLYRDRYMPFHISGYDEAKKHLTSLSSEQKNRIKLIFGHFVYYGIHELFDRECRYITFLRHPLDRTISHYNWARTLFARGNVSEENVNIVFSQDTDLSFKTWFEKRETENISRDNYISGYLLDFLSGNRLGLDNFTEEDLKKAKDALKKFYFVGITGNHEDIFFIYHLIGIKRFWNRINSSKSFLSPADEERITKTYSHRIKNDLELFDHATELNKNFKTRYANFRIITGYMKVKAALRYFQTIFTEIFEYMFREISTGFKFLRDRIVNGVRIIYDFIMNLIMISIDSAIHITRVLIDSIAHAMRVLIEKTTNTIKLVLDIIIHFSRIFIDFCLHRYRLVSEILINNIRLLINLSFHISRVTIAGIIQTYRIVIDTILNLFRIMFDLLINAFRYFCDLTIHSFRVTRDVILHSLRATRDVILHSLRVTRDVILHSLRVTRDVILHSLRVTRDVILHFLRTACYFAVNTLNKITGGYIPGLTYFIKYNLLKRLNPFIYAGMLSSRLKKHSKTYLHMILFLKKLLNKKYFSYKSEP